MLTLALDTATGVCTVGLVQDGHVLAEYDISVGLTHSEGLMPQLDQSDGLCLAVWYLWCQYVAGYGL